MNLSTLRLAFAGTALVASMAASAADGTITFTGDITATTCIVGPGTGAGGAAKAIKIKLPELATSALGTDGATNGDTDFSLKLGGGADCVGQSGKLGKMAFSGANINPTTGRLTNTGTAANVEVELVSAGTPLHLANDKIDFAVNATGDNEFPMTARYRASGGAAGQGDVSTTVEYTLSYN